jgi:hypothetical protein
MNQFFIGYLCSFGVNRRMLLTEILSTAVPWKWTFFDSEHAEAAFTVGDVPYMMLFNYGEHGWVMSLANDKKRKTFLGRVKGDVNSQDTFGMTGSGNASVVMATATEIVRAFKGKHPDAAITFTAVEPSRQKLYLRMLRRAGVPFKQQVAQPGAAQVFQIE